jgi:hypothetical protein
MATLAAAARAPAATIHALQGDSSAARQIAEELLSFVRSDEMLSMTVMARRATALPFVANGQYDLAYAQFRLSFGDDGTPLHHHLSYLSIAELAGAAVRTGRRAECRKFFERDARTLNGIHFW